MTPRPRISRVRERSPQPERRQRDDHRAEVLGVQLEEVAAPVVLEHAVELGQDRGEQLLGRHRVADGVLPAAARPALAARRERDVREERQHLDRRQRDAQTDRGQREGRWRPAAGLPGGRSGSKQHEIERPETRRRRAGSTPSGYCGLRMPRPTIEREQRVARRDCGPGSPRSSARNASGASAETKSLPSCPGFTSDATMPVSSYASPPTSAAAHPHPKRPQQQVHREAGEHQMDREAEVHRRIHRQDPAEPRGGIEDVAVHRRDERQAAEEIGIPLGNVAGLPEHLARRRGGSCSPPRTGRRPAGTGRRAWASRASCAAMAKTHSANSLGCRGSSRF